MTPADRDPRKLQAFLDTLNPAQRDAVVAPDGPALVFAGAGSGKTRVLTGRAYYLIVEALVHPQSVLVVTFTNKAAGELRERLRQYLGERTALPWAGTFHSFCARLLRTHGEGVGRSRNFSIYDTADSEAMLAALLAERRITREELSPGLLRHWISLLKNGRPVTSEHRRAELAMELLPEYNRRLQLANAVDFDDLLRLPLELFRRDPAVQERIQRAYDHVLIDEFQDTNRTQYDLAAAIAAPQNNLFAVGDDDQSIYGWRGADHRNLLDFQKDFPRARVFHLEQNYRSTQEILNVANDVIAVNQTRAEKRLWTDNPSGEKAVLRQVARSFDEATEVVGEIVHLTQSKGYAWGDYAILMRTNAQTRSFEDVLIAQAIPYTVVGSTRFYDRKEIRDLLAFLRLMVNPEDDQAWRRILRTPPKGIGDVTVKRLDDEARRRGTGIGAVLADAAAISEIAASACKRLDSVAAAIDAMRERIAALPLDEQVADVLHASGLEEYYAEQDAAEAGERTANLSQLVDAARDRANLQPGLTLTDFVAEIALLSDLDSYEQTARRVTLMTLHAAKGLEFPVVFVTGIEENLLPHQRSKSSAAELEEERRLFYVGITRARELLYLSYSQCRHVNGMLEFQTPSRFLYDIAPAHLRGWSLPEGASRNRFNDNLGDGDRILERRTARRFARSAEVAPDTMLMPYKIGDLVRHPEFGMGVVTAKSGGAEDLRIRVAFEGMGSKLLAVKFAPLTRVES